MHELRTSAALHTAERVLLYAVLEKALRDIINCDFADTTDLRNARQAFLWLIVPGSSSERDHVFSADMVCYYLCLPLPDIRARVRDILGEENEQHILVQRSQQLRGRSARCD